MYDIVILRKTNRTNLTFLGSYSLPTSEPNVYTLGRSH